MASSFQVEFRRGLPFGAMVGVSLPSDPATIKPSDIKRLHSAEREYARGLTGLRKSTWIGGRIALSKALSAIGAEKGPVLSGNYGEPQLPSIYTGSVSHKKHLAVAIAAKKQHGLVGIDLEDATGRPRDVAHKVLTPTELADVGELPEHLQWPATLMRFSMKEAVYKALFPHVRRYIGFQEAEVTVHINGPSTVRLNLSENDGGFIVEARYHWIGTRILSVARIRKEEEAPSR